MGLSAVMLVVVTGVSLLVQLYSQEYMRGDDGYNRYYAFMSLFTAVDARAWSWSSSILQLFVFWELVGLCSYLLIGFWFFKDSARRGGDEGVPGDADRRHRVHDRAAARSGRRRRR